MLQIILITAVEITVDWNNIIVIVKVIVTQINHLQGR